MKLKKDGTPKKSGGAQKGAGAKTKEVKKVPVAIYVQPKNKAKVKELLGLIDKNL
jgi:hypothetical protein